MGATSKSGYGGPNTAGPGGQGRDYNGNARGSNMPGQFVIGGAPRLIGGPAPIPGGRPAPGDLYRPGGQPGFGPGLGNVIGQIGGIGGGMINQINPGMKPIGDAVGGVGRVGGDVVNRFMPGRGMIPPAGGRIGNPRQFNPEQGPMQPGQPQQPPSYGGGKGGFQGPMTQTEYDYEDGPSRNF